MYPTPSIPLLHPMDRRTPCQYGAACYRQNPEHFQKHSHPGDEGQRSRDHSPMPPRGRSPMPPQHDYQDYQGPPTNQSGPPRGRSPIPPQQFNQGYPAQGQPQQQVSAIQYQPESLPMIFYPAQAPARGFRSMMRSAAGHAFDAGCDVGSAYYHGAGHLAHNAAGAAGSALGAGAAMYAGYQSWDQGGGGGGY